MNEAALSPPYALVTLLIGVNNQYRGLPLEAYRVEFAALLGCAIALVGDRSLRVLVVSIPDWGVTPFARAQGGEATHIASEIDTFNSAAKTIAEDHGVAFVDITKTSRSVGAQADMLVADGLHPSASQYTHWVERIAPAAVSALLS